MFCMSHKFKVACNLIIGRGLLKLHGCVYISSNSYFVVKLSGRQNISRVYCCPRTMWGLIKQQGVHGQIDCWAWDWKSRDQGV